jgi:uncharacterized protein YdeI (YjbR/CyaY-like superfamily)
MTWPEAVDEALCFGWIDGIRHRKAAIWWVVSAKKPETKDRRLETLIDDSANARRIRPLRRNPAAAG